MKRLARVLIWAVLAFAVIWSAFTIRLAVLAYQDGKWLKVILFMAGLVWIWKPPRKRYVVTIDIYDVKTGMLVLRQQVRLRYESEAEWFVRTWPMTVAAMARRDGTNLWRFATEVTYQKR